MAAPPSLRETALAGLALAAGLGLTRGGHAAPGAEAPAPGHPSRDYLQYGLALAVQAVASPGGVCPPDTENPCILGSGAGIGVRAGYRARAPFYLGGAYEFSRHDSSNLLRLAILQQFRGEGRYYFDQGTRTTAFVTAAAGFLLYGNEWAASTAGPLAAIGAGVELQLSPSTTLGSILTYRLLMPRKWVDGTGVERADQFLGFGFAHVVGLEFTLEVQDPIPRF